MNKLRKLLFLPVLLLLAGVFVFAAWKLISYYRETAQTNEKYAAIAALRGEEAPPRPPIHVSEPGQTEPADDDSTQPTENPWVTVTHPQTGEEVQLLPEFEKAFLLNPELVGWIAIEGTNVNYPVVQSAVDHKDYYLRRDFYGNSDSHGCIYAREQCDVFAPSDNIVIYGHRMRDHTMFGHLAKYEQKSFLEDHSYIYFDTLLERHTYQIAYVMVTTANPGEGFAYHTFVDGTTPEQWEEFLSGCEQYSLYDTGVTVSPGDKLITLSTCEYTHENGRLVIVAKQVG